MTRINGTIPRGYNEFRATRTGRHGATFMPRITPTSSELVNDEPIEEIVFEPGGGSNQRATQRGFAITEHPEENQTAECDRSKGPDCFWQGFSTPFMAQVIGQVNKTPDARLRAYRQPQLTPAPQQRALSRAC